VVSTFEGKSTMAKRPLLFTLVGTVINTLGIISPRAGAKVAMYLFQKPNRKELNPKEVNYLNEARLEVPNSDSDIGYYRWGTSDRYILLNHGWESGAIRWKPYVSRLVDLGYSVVAADAPGHGLSTSNKFNAYLYSRALYPLIKHCRPEIVIGHSIGGFVSVLTGAEQPQYQPNHYILLAPNNKIRDTFATYQQMLGMSDRVISVAIEQVREITPEGHPIEYFESEKLIHRIPVPIEIIHDTDDVILAFSESKRLADLHDNVGLHKTEGYGHRLKSRDIIDTVIDLVKNID